MSAAAPLPQQHQIRGFCSTGLSYFERLLGLNRPSEILVFGLILVETIGKPGHPRWAEITDRQFADATNKTKEQYLDALAMLEKWGYVKQRKNEDSGRCEYSVSDTFRDESHAKRVHGRCPHCLDIIAIDHKFIPIPHIVFRKLGACLDAAAYACLMVILRYTLHVTKERGVYATPEQLDIEDFARHTGYEDSSITKALSKLCDENGYALVQRKQQPGKPAIFCPALDRFYQMERRAPRTVNREDKANISNSPTPIRPIVKEVGHGNESADTKTWSSLKPYGFCQKCDRYVDVDPVSEREARLSVEKSPPTTPKPIRKPVSRMEKMWDKLKQWHG